MDGGDFVWLIRRGHRQRPPYIQHLNWLTNGALDNGRECSPMEWRQLNYGKDICTNRLSFAALATGGLIVNSIGLGRAMSRLSVSLIEFHLHTNRTFDPYMPIWLSVLWQEV